MTRLFPALLLLACAPWLGAQQPRRPSVRATGEASVAVTPDQAKIEIGVVTQAATAQQAAAQNAAQVEKVISQLKQAAGANAALKTANYSLSPNYNYPPNGGTPTLNGYTASNTVQLTSSDLAGIGKVIDAATQAGANRVVALQFGLKNDLAAKSQALKLAAAEAKSRAEAIAAGLGGRVGSVIAAQESVPEGVRPMMAQARLAAAPTPVEPGSVEVSATVTLEMEFLP